MAEKQEQCCAAQVPLVVLVDVRVFLSNGKKASEIDRFLSPCVPRVGDHFYVQADAAEIYRVSWWSESHKAHADVYCHLDS